MEEGAEGEEAGAYGCEISLCGGGGGVFFVVFVVVLVFGFGSGRVGTIVIVPAEIAYAAIIEGPLRDLALFVRDVLSFLGFVTAEGWG